MFFQYLHAIHLRPFQKIEAIFFIIYVSVKRDQLRTLSALDESFDEAAEAKFRFI